MGLGWANLIFVVAIYFRHGLLAPKYNPVESKNRSGDLEASLIGTFKLVYFRNTLSVYFRIRRISTFARYDLVLLLSYNGK